jgi:hypothetical protein
MTEQNFSPQESLQVIQSMIEKAKNQFSENGHLYLLWGWVVFGCSIAQFILLKFVQSDKHYLVWFACWLAAFYQFFYLRKQSRGKRVKTYADRMIGYIWISFIILMVLIGSSIAVTGGEEYYKFFAPAFLAMYGVPTFLSGVFLQFRRLITGGIGCWALSLLAHVIPYEYQLLLLSAAMIIAWIIPGYALRKMHQQSAKTF